MSVVSSAIIETKATSDISANVYSCLTYSIHSSKSFCISFDVPLKTVALFKWSLTAASNAAVKLTSPQNTPGFSDSKVSSCALSANSNSPQNFIQSIIFYKTYLFFLTPSLLPRYFAEMLHSVVGICLSFQKWKYLNRHSYDWQTLHAS